MWKGTDFRFRAVEGTYKVVLWGSGVYVFAGGQGNVTLTGSADTPKSDGRYSLNGGDWSPRSRSRRRRRSATSPAG